MTACSSSGGEKSDKAGSGGASSKAGGFSSSPIKVLTIFEQGTQSSNFASDKVATAFAKNINSKGGINGHELVVETCNEKADPNAATACARKAVQDKVVAVVGGFVQNGGNIEALLEPASIPWIGPPGDSAQELSAKNSFLLGAGPLTYAGLASEAVKDCKTIAAAVLDIPATAALLPFISGVLAKGKKQLAKTVKVPATTTDFSSIAKSLQGIDCTEIILPDEQTAPLVSAMKSLGVKSRIYSAIAGLSPALIAKNTQQLEGSVLATSFVTADDPAWNAAKRALGSGVSVENPILQNDYISYYVLQHVVAKMTGEVTAPSLLKALSATTAIDTGGLTAPLDFSKSVVPLPTLSRIFNPNVAFYKVQSGKLVKQGGFVNLLPTLGG